MEIQKNKDKSKAKDQECERKVKKTLLTGKK